MKEANRGYDLTIKVNEFDLSYNDIGEGRVPIIFLHGFPFDKTMWNKQCEFLKKIIELLLATLEVLENQKMKNRHLAWVCLQMI